MPTSVTPLQAIHERLDRADECLRNLDGEIRVFLDESKYPFVPQDDTEMLLKAVDYHRSRQVPIRFGILSGEIIHHLRSCLDHIAWQLSSQDRRRHHPTAIEFPVFEVRPIGKNERAAYKRKIKGISNPDALRLIEQLQPYNSPSPFDSNIFIIHKMDVCDKHREIVVCDSTGQAEIALSHIPREIMDKHLAGEDVIAEIYAQVKKYGKVTPQVSFEYPPQRPRKPMTSLLLRGHCSNPILH